MKLLFVLSMACVALVALPFVAGAFGLLAGICGALIGLAAAALSVIAAVIGIVVGFAVLLAPIWIPVLLIAGIVALCNRSHRSA